MAAACGGASALGALLLRGRLLRTSRNYSAGYSAGGRGKGALVQRGRTSQNDKYRRETATPRTEKMEVDQDWTSVYPVAAAFKPSCVPLPLRMGYPVKRGVPPVKEGNLELLKIPNFLHLTPVAIRKHCAALKDFCTEWPADVDNDEKCMQHFPIEVDTVDYISAGPSVRNPKARMVTLTKTEEWEKEKTEADMEEYIWENSASEKNALETLVRIRAGDRTEEVSRQELLASQKILAYRKSVVELKNEGETDKNLSEYKNSVRRLLNMSELQ
ncbi:small ribosomal subunit protein mS35 isoform X3 [Podarcis muralis]